MDGCSLCLILGGSIGRSKVGAEGRIEGSSGRGGSLYFWASKVIMADRLDREEWDPGVSIGL